VDKVFGWWRREGQERQATQRQSTDPPACQGKIPLQKFSARLSRGESRDESSEDSIYLNHFFRRIFWSAVLCEPAFYYEQLLQVLGRKKEDVDSQDKKKVHYIQVMRIFSALKN